MFESVNLPKELKPEDPRFGVGPSLVPTEFMEKLANTGCQLLGTSHRKPAVKDLVKEVQEGIKKYFKVPEDYSIVLGNGGATLVWDMVATGIVEKKITHFTCGEFSSKWYKSSQLAPGIEAEEIKVEYGQGINPELSAGSDVIACTLNETSTGVQMSSLPDVDDKTILAMDATSGAGQVPCDVSKVDIFYFSPQKVFASEGGLWIAVMSPKGRERALRLAEDKTRYIPPIFNWNTAITNSDKNQTYNTPSLSTLFFLNEQVKKMNNAGYDGVIEDGRKKSELLYGWADSKPYLKAYIEVPEFRSSSVACIDVDDKIDVTALLKKLAAEDFVYNIDSYRKLGRNQFRIGMFYNIKHSDLEKLTKLLSHCIEAVL